MNWQEVWNTIGTAAVTALVGVLCVVIKVLGDAAIKYIVERTAAVKDKAGADKWEHWMQLARWAWGMADEECRTHPEIQTTIAAKQTQFETFIRKMIPGLTDDQIVQLRQAVAGEVNKGKAEITAQATDEQGNISGEKDETTTEQKTEKQSDDVVRL